MISLKLIFRNVHKNMREYFIYFLTKDLDPLQTEINYSNRNSINYYN